MYQQVGPQPMMMPPGPQMMAPGPMMMPPGPQMMAPGGMQWNFMPQPPSIPGCPPGLEYLTYLEGIVVRQEVEMLEVFTGIDTANRYRVCTATGQQIWFAAEETQCCAQVCCGPYRPFVIIVNDVMGRNIMRIQRDLKLCALWMFCACADLCQNTLSIEAPPGTPIGYVRQKWSCLAPKYEILDTDQNPILFIIGPICRLQCCEVDFQIFSVSQPEVMIGKITKKIENLLLEMLTNADTFGVTFPLDLDVKLKATLFSAVFLIDFMYFEDTHQDQHREDHGPY